MNKKTNSLMNHDYLKEFGDFSNIMIIVYTHKKILFANDCFVSSTKSDELDLEFETIYSALSQIEKNKRLEIGITNKQDEVLWFDCALKDVMYEDQPAIFAMLFDIDERVKYRKDENQITKLHRLVIEISQSILGGANLPDFFELVLEKTLKATNKATLGTILVLEGDVFSAAASYGYKEDIKNFKLPKEKSFSYQATNGAFDRIINISDTTTSPYYVPIKTQSEDQLFIQSSLSAPIYVDQELYGTVNLDSLEKNAFNKEDIQALEFIRNSIEIAITNRLLYEEKAYLSQYDRMTSLHNRYFFEEHSDYVLKKAKRYNEVFHLVMIDIDDLKYVNDTYGHVVGDILIKQVAHTIKNKTRKSDVFARYGGDEFIGLIFNTTLDQIRKILLSIEESLATTPIVYEKQKISVSISYGVATFSLDATSIHDLINVADKRMYASKETKKSMRDNSYVPLHKI
jgi:diguanylate cyclase (GGDEF)-like protein